MALRKYIIGGNWKMYKTPSEALSTIKALTMKVVNVKKVDMVVCPPSIDILAVRDIVRNSAIKIGGQNMHWQDEGAFTGEISSDMLLDAGCEFVVIGHSERRHIFGETDSDVNRKVAKALNANLNAIFCIGETLEQRNSGEMEKTLERQINEGLQDIDLQNPLALVVAYEPVWAIGTGVNASPEQAEEAHLFVRSLLARKYGGELAEAIRIQYGGSVKPGNARELLGQPNVDGALIGGASLDADSFSSIIKIAEEL